MGIVITRTVKNPWGYLTGQKFMEQVTLKDTDTDVQLKAYFDEMRQRYGSNRLEPIYDSFTYFNSITESLSCFTNRFENSSDLDVCYSLIKASLLANIDEGVDKDIDFIRDCADSKDFDLILAQMLFDKSFTEKMVRTALEEWKTNEKKCQNLNQNCLDNLSQYKKEKAVPRIRKLDNYYDSKNKEYELNEIKNIKIS